MLIDIAAVVFGLSIWQLTKTRLYVYLFVGSTSPLRLMLSLWWSNTFKTVYICTTCCKDKVSFYQTFFIQYEVNCRSGW